MTHSSCFGRRRLTGLFLSLIAWLFTGTAIAQDAAPQYDVELVIFRNLGGQATPEDWVLEEAIANRGKISVGDDSDTLAERLTSSAEALPVQALTPDQLKLGPIAASLRASRGYRLLSHIGWTQAALPLRSGTVTPLSSMLGAATPLSGTAKLSRGATLHLTLDLRLKEADGPSYVLQETRQIKLGEKYYFDHPHFGVVASVSARQP